MRTAALWAGAFFAVLAVGTAEACTPCCVCSPAFNMPLNRAPSVCNICGFYYVLPDCRLQGPNYILRPPFPPVAGFSGAEVGQGIYAILWQKHLCAPQPQPQHHQPSHGTYNLQQPQGQPLPPQGPAPQQQPQNPGIGIGNRGGGIDYSEPYQFQGPDPLPGGYHMSTSDYRRAYSYYPPAAWPHGSPGAQPGVMLTSAQTMATPYTAHYCAPPALPNPVYAPPYTPLPTSAYTYPYTPLPMPAYTYPYTPLPTPAYTFPYTPLPTLAYEQPAVPAPGYTMPPITTPSPTYNPALPASPQLPTLTFIPPACPAGPPLFPSHGYVRSPRDFFMWGDVQLEQRNRDRRPTQVP